MNIQNRSLDTYTAFQSQAERFGSLRVAPPPRRSEEPAGITTANGESATNNPVELGWVQMNVSTGDIIPKTLSANGYTLKVIGVAEVDLLED